jgi:hypothetical protein
MMADVQGPRITFDPPYRTDIAMAINEDGVDDVQACRLVFVHQHHEVIQREILEVLWNHPLDRGQALRGTSEVKVVVESAWPPPSPTINSSAWPTLFLRLPAKDAMLAALHAILCHEFTHVVDRLDPGFGLSPSAEVPSRVVTLWNHSIDARLARHGIRVPHCLEEPIDPIVASVVAGRERPTYAWLVTLAGEDVADNDTRP